MYEKITKNLATKLKIQDKYIVNVLNLLEEGNTIAFIARYRKELTNSLDEVAIKQIQDEFKQIDHIKYAVKTVNDDYGIDLSIEIDKAIKRGEKPSVIAQLKKFQEQQEKAEQYHNKVKEKYRGEER